MTRSFNDILALIATATVIGVLLLGSAFVLARWGLGVQWFAFVWLTLFMFGIIGWTLPREIRRRRRRLYKKWLPVATFVGLFTIHCAGLGTVLFVWRPDWRFVEWTVLTIAEMSAIGLALEIAYRFAITETAFRSKRA